MGEAECGTVSAGRNEAAEGDIWGVGCSTVPAARGSMSIVCRRARKRTISGGVNNASGRTTLKYLGATYVGGRALRRGRRMVPLS